MSKLGTIMVALKRSSPVATLALLLVLPTALPNRAVFDPETSSRRREIAHAMEQLPYTIGPWVGADEAVPPAAVKLLRPNAIVSRRYERIPNGPTVTLIMVHCSDARDMVGHYPPICYPSAGWSFRGSRSGREAVLSLAGRSAPAMVYEFTRRDALGHEGGIRVANAFVLPDGSVSPAIDDVYAQSERLAESVRGATQIQIITSTAVPDAAAAHAAEEILAGLEEFFRTLGVGREPRDV